MFKLFKILLLYLVMVGIANAATPTPTKKLPGEAERDLPQLSMEIDKFWPDLNPREFPAGIIDQESGWKPKATLKTSREFGCGYGQFTVAYNSDGSVRFNAIDETKRLDPSLQNWNTADCYNTTYQLRGVVLKLKTNERNCKAIMSGNIEVKACVAAQYNGGAGSISKRIRTCRTTPGCDSMKWFNNLEKQCPQSQVKVAGYGESFCDINSKYPQRVFSRMPKFQGKV